MVLTAYRSGVLVVGLAATTLFHSSLAFRASAAGNQIESLELSQDAEASRRLRARGQSRRLQQDGATANLTPDPGSPAGIGQPFTSCEDAPTPEWAVSAAAAAADGGAAVAPAVAAGGAEQLVDYVSSLAAAGGQPPAWTVVDLGGQRFRQRVSRGEPGLVLAANRTVLRNGELELLPGQRVVVEGVRELVLDGVNVTREEPGGSQAQDLVRVGAGSSVWLNHAHLTASAPAGGGAGGEASLPDRAALKLAGGASAVVTCSVARFARGSFAVSVRGRGTHLEAWRCEFGDAELSLLNVTAGASAAVQGSSFASPRPQELGADTPASAYAGGGAALEVSGSAFRGGNAGLLAEGGSSLSLRGIDVESAASWGLVVREGASVAAEQLHVENAPGGSMTTGVVLESGASLRASGVRVRGPVLSGIEAAGRTTLLELSNSTVAETFTGVDAGGSATARLLACNLTSAGRSAVSVRGAGSSALLQGCRFERNFVSLSVETSSNAVVEDSVFLEGSVGDMDVRTRGQLLVRRSTVLAVQSRAAVVTDASLIVEDSRLVGAAFNLIAMNGNATVTVSRSHLRGTPQPLVFVAAVNGTVRLEDSTLVDSGSAGLDVLTAGAVVDVLRSTLANNSGPGMQLAEGVVATVRDTQLRNNSRAGVSMSDTQFTAFNLTITDNTEQGVAVGPRSRVTLESSRVARNVLDGVLASAGTASLALSGCSVTGNAGAGVSVLSGAQAVLRQGECAGNGGAGVQVTGRSSALDVVGMRLARNGGAGLAASGNASAACVACQIEGNGGSGVDLEEGAEFGGEDVELADNALDGLRASGGAVAALVGSRASNNTLYGFRAAGPGSLLQLTGTAAAGNGLGPLLLERGATAIPQNASLAGELFPEGSAPLQAARNASSSVQAGDLPAQTASPDSGSGGTGTDLATVLGPIAAGLVILVVVLFLIRRSARPKPAGLKPRELQKVVEPEPPEALADLEDEGKHLLRHVMGDSTVASRLDMNACNLCDSPSGTLLAAPRRGAVCSDGCEAASSGREESGGDESWTDAAGQAYEIVTRLVRVRSDVDLAVDLDRDVVFREEATIGSGATSVVRLGVWRERQVAVKVFEPSRLPQDAAGQRKLKNLLRSFEREMMMMARMDHPCIVTCFGGRVCGDGCSFILMEYIGGGTLARYVHSSPTATSGRGLPEAEVLASTLQIALALLYLHPVVMHADLKPENVLLSREGISKLSDFGLSRVKLSTTVSQLMNGAGTPAYMAPEMWGAEPQTHAADIFALGVQTWELLAGEKPWAGLEAAQITQAVLSGDRPAIPERCSAEMRKLLAGMWEQDPLRRWTANSVVQEIRKIRAMTATGCNPAARATARDAAASAVAA